MNQKTKILALIPARMDSSRFPGKPMEMILSKPMIGHVYDNVKENSLLTSTVVATCDDEIANYIKSIKNQNNKEYDVIFNNKYLKKLMPDLRLIKLSEFNFRKIK